MRILQSKLLHLLLVWLCIVPPSMIYLSIHFWPSNLNWFYFFAIMLFSFLSALFPVKINGKQVYLVFWITVPAFLVYGVFIELLAMQVVVLTVLFSTYKHKVKGFRILFGTLIFFIISLVSAVAFYIVGGEIGMLDFWPLVGAVIVYQFTQRVIYASLYAIYQKANKEFENRYVQQILLETFILFLILPFALTSYYLLQYIGIGAFFLLAIPLFFLIFVFRRYNHSEKINEALARVNEMGHRLTLNTNEDGLIDEFVESVAHVFDAQFVYLYKHYDDWLEPLRIYESAQFQEITSKQLILAEKDAATLLAKKKPVLYKKRKDWVTLSEGYHHSSMQSMFAIPILRDEKVTGVLVVASKRKKEFKKYYLEIADILCSYFTVSMIRARNIEQTTQLSERCGLTNLYNYHYLEERLNFEFNRFKQGNSSAMTILMIDIDYFKKVNDTYGHESGNEILIALARLLERYTPRNGIVGRYGGEEFMYILPDVTKAEGLQLGEQVRTGVANHLFTISPALKDSGRNLQVSITISIGVSSIPEDTAEVTAVVRNADRALYVGAKRAGRNRVSGYVK